MNASDKKMLTKILGKLSAKLKGGQKGRATGIVKWFNNSKGIGFITPADGGEDLFVHYSKIQGNGYKLLEQGQSVEFDITQGPRGYSAENIRLL